MTLMKLITVKALFWLFLTYNLASVDDGTSEKSILTELEVKPVHSQNLNHSKKKSPNPFKSTEIESVFPRIGDKKGGTMVALRGTNFPGDARVVVDGVECNPLNILENLIECLTQAQDKPGDGSVQIISGSGAILFSTEKHVFDTYEKWSDSKTWTSGKVPSTDENVVILADQTVLLDEPTAMLGSVTIRGSLILEDVPGLTLDARSLALDKGRLVIGGEESPFVNDLTVTLHGDQHSPIDSLNDSIFCNDCEMEIHGRPSEESSSETEGVSLKNIAKNFVEKSNLKNNIKIQAKRMTKEEPGNVVVLTNHNLRQTHLNFTNFEMEVKDQNSMQRKFWAHSILGHKHVKSTLMNVGRILNVEVNYRNWSDGGSWGGTKPLASDTKTEIEASWNMLLDESTPILEHLVIKGHLTFDPSKDGLTLNAKIIEIEKNGMLIIGKSDEPFTKKASIILHGGENDTKVEVIQNTLSVNNAIINKGSIEIHGEVLRQQFIRLDENAKDTNVITVDDVLHKWQPNDEVVVTSSKIQAEQYELTKYLSHNEKEMTLASTLKFYHLKNNEYNINSRRIELGARVANLTRNIVIQSASPAWGCTLVSAGFDFGDKNEGYFNINGVEFKYCGQWDGKFDSNNQINNGAVHVEGYVDRAETNVLKDCVINTTLGFGIALKDTKKVRIENTTVFRFKNAGIQINNSEEFDIESNMVLASTSHRIPIPGQIVIPNVGIEYIGTKTLEQSDSSVRNNHVSSVGIIGVGLVFPGYECDITYSNPTLYRFYNNLVHSTDAGWHPIRDFPTKDNPMQCQKFLNFKSYKIKFIAFAYLGKTPQIEIEEMVLTDSENGIMTTIEPTPNNEDRYVNIKNSGIVGRSFPSDTELYDGAAECEIHGISTPFYSSTVFAENPLYNGLDLHKYVDDNLPARQDLRNVSFKNFNHDSTCTKKTYALRVNELYQTSPVTVYIRDIKFENVSSESKVEFKTQTTNSNPNTHCSDTPCTGLSNSVIYDLDGSIKGNGEEVYYYGSQQDLTDNQTVCSKNSVQNTFDCKPVFGQIYIERSTQINATDLFPMKIKVDTSINNQEIVKYDNQIEGTDNSGSQIKLREINELTLPTDFVSRFFIQMMGANNLDWAVFRVKTTENYSISVYDNGTKVDRLVLETDRVQNLLLYTETCGVNYFERATNSIYFLMNGNGFCKLEVVTSPVVESSLKLTASQKDFFAQNGVETVREYLYTTLGLDPSSGVVNISNVMEPDSVVFFEVELNNDALTDPNEIKTNLEGEYCKIVDKLKLSKSITPFTAENNLGLAQFRVNGLTTDKDYLPTCNDDHHEAFPCVSWQESPLECLVCDSRFEKNGTICDPLNCAKKNDQNICTECETGYWIDLRSYDSCHLYSTDDRFDNCTTKRVDADECGACDSTYFLSQKECVKSNTDVPNCTKYKGHGVCEVCDSEFGLTVNDKCEGGKVANCSIYKTSDTCVTCKTNFYLESSSSCKEYSSELNCKTFNPTKNACVDCNDGFRLVSSNYCEENTRCAGFSSNGKDCSICKSGFYLDPNVIVCKTRTAEHCLTEEEQKDECVKCIAKYWKNAANDNKCQPVTDVPGCEVYKENADECMTCASGKILTNNKCEDEDLTVANCIVYQSFGVCKQCEPNYLLFESKCHLKDIEGCETYTTPTECSACTSMEYFLKADFQCQKYSDDLFCKDFKVDKDECNTCPDFFQLQTSNKCKKIENCDKFNETNKQQCEICNINSVLNASKDCVLRTAEHCAEVSLTVDQCTKCNSLYYLDSTNQNKCTPITPKQHCQEYETDKDQCKNCAAGFYLDSNNLTCAGIQNIIDHCQIYDNQQNCVTCKEGFFLESNKCVRGSIDGCVSYSSKEVCNDCETGFFLSSGTCTRYSTDLNCLEFSPTADECMTCKIYHQLESNKKCVFVDNCAIFDQTNNQDCLTCIDSYYLQNRRCFLRNLTNCEKYVANKNECETCEINYYVNKNQNSICSLRTIVAGCSAYKLDSNECLSCASGQYVNNLNQCVSVTSSIPQCLYYTSNGICARCLDNYFLTDNECKIGTIQGCKIYDSISTCAECQSNYYIKNSTECIAYSSDLNCKTFNKSADKCEDCFEYSYLDSATSKCVKIENCAKWEPTLKNCRECEPTHFLVESTYCSLRTAPNCETFYLNQDKCITCKANNWMNRLKNDECTNVTAIDDCGTYAMYEDKCIKCEAGKYLDNNECKTVNTVITNCQNYGSNNVCATCDPDYFLTNNLCQKGNITFCEIYETLESCYQCQEKYYLEASDKCTLYSTGLDCKTFSRNENKCINCNPPYQLTSEGACRQTEGCVFTDGKCTLCQTEYLYDTSRQECVPRKAENCATYSATEDKCETCLQLFFIDESNDNVCTNRQNIRHCQTFLISKDECDECELGFENVKGVCQIVISKIPSCKRYVVDGQCEKCQENYNLNNNSCVKEIVNCELVNAQLETCDKCKSNYYLEDPKQCTPYSFHANCLKLDPNKDQCQTCTEYFEFDSNNICVENGPCVIKEIDGKTCNTCQLGYSLNTETKRCETQLVDGCKTYNPTTKACTECHSPYVLDEGICVEESMSLSMILLITFLCILFLLFLLLLLLLCCKYCCGKKEEGVAKSLDSFRPPDYYKKSFSKTSSEFIASPKPLDLFKTGSNNKNFDYNPQVFNEKLGGSSTRNLTGQNMYSTNQNNIVFRDGSQ